MTTTADRPEPARNVWFVRNVPQETRTLAGQLAGLMGITIAQVLTAALEEYAVSHASEHRAIFDARTRVTSPKP